MFLLSLVRIIQFSPSKFFSRCLFASVMLFAATQLDKDARTDAYVVESENFESIHNYSAYALIEKD